MRKIITIEVEMYDLPSSDLPDIRETVLEEGINEMLKEREYFFSDLTSEVVKVEVK